MEEKKLTDEEIVKALECCKQKGGKDTCKYCYTCPASVWDFEDGITECNVDLFQKAINLIHRLQSDLKTCSNIEKQEKETNAELRQEIERLKIDIKNEKNWGKIQTKQTVKDTAKEILQTIMFIIKKSNGFLAEEVIRIMAKQKGVEVE